MRRILSKKKLDFLKKQQQAKNKIQSIHGWSTWTPEQAENYIENQVNGLPETKMVLKEIVKLLILLRDK